MTLNKRRTSSTMKVLIIVLIVALVGGVLLAGTGGLAGLFAGAPAPAPAGQGQQQQPQTVEQAAPTGVVARIRSNEAALKSSPKSFALLIELGNGYFDWAIGVQQAAALRAQGLERPIWLRSAGYYERALAATKTLDPQVATDLSVAYHYGGQNAKAITLIGKVLKLEPNLPQAIINAGVFYESANQPAVAAKYYERYLKLPNLDAKAKQAAEQRLAGLKK